VAQAFPSNGEPSEDGELLKLAVGGINRRAVRDFWENSLEASPFIL